MGMALKMSVEVDLEDERKAECVARALAEDMKKHARSETQIKSEGSLVNFNFKARDKTALRASFNSNLRLFESCVNVIEKR
jgi:tRNA threonylcarbamoyladenosine modification (KEOPS) complex  Pcc1 subunit